MRIARGLLCLTLPLLASTGCTSGEEGTSDTSGAATSSTSDASAAVTEPALPQSDLPGDEALSPPPPDPAGPDMAARLAELPVGAFAGTVDLAVSGLTAFTEPVQGRCTETTGGRGFELTLSDGSQLQVGFGPDGGASRLTAPGIEVEQTLSDVELEVAEGVRFSAGLLTEGTTEPSGHLALDGTCA